MTESEGKPRLSPVVLKVYDVTRGMSRVLGTQILGYPLEGVWHTGLVVFGKEFFYGGGIQEQDPVVFERENDLRPAKEMVLGETSKTLHEFQGFLQQVAPQFTEATYDLLKWNCNHFTNACTVFLLDLPIPREYLNQHEPLLATPMGAMLVRMLEGMSIQNPVGRSSSSVGAVESSCPQPNSNTLAPETHSSLERTAFGKALVRFFDAQEAGKRVAALQFLDKIAGNVLGHATDPKYRSLRCSNATLNSLILNVVPEGEECLAALGFTRASATEASGTATSDPSLPEHQTNSSEDVFRFPHVQADTLRELQRSRATIQAALQGCQGGVSSRCASTLASETVVQPAPITGAAPTETTLYDVQMRKLEAMGFTDTDACLKALQEGKGNLNAALDKLLS